MCDREMVDDMVDSCGGRGFDNFVILFAIKTTAIVKSRDITLYFQ